MMKTTPTIERYGDSVVVVARNAEEAQQAAMDELGAGCTVTAVERVRTGGVGGFFSTEMVRLTARAAGATLPAPTVTEVEMASAEDLLASLNSRTSGFAERLLEVIAATQDADGQEAASRGTGTLRPPLAPLAEIPVGMPAEHHAARSQPPSWTTWSPVMDAMPNQTDAGRGFDPTRFDGGRSDGGLDIDAGLAAFGQPATTLPPPDTAWTAHAAARFDATPSGFGAPTPATRADLSGWSAAALRVLGVPDSIVTAVEARRPFDDVSWLSALMDVLRPLCETPQPGATLVVGPACANLARQLRFMSITAEELPETISSVAVPHIAAKDLMAAADGRSVHLVVGGSWQHLATVPTAVVSAATDDDLLDALRTAAAWGGTLGWIWRGERYERIDPFFVASRLRDAILACRQAPSGDDRAADERAGNDRSDDIDTIPVR